MVWATLQDTKLSHVEENGPGCCILPHQFHAVDALMNLDYMRMLKVASESFPLRLSGIICTIGPASLDPVILEQMMEAGMNIACLNFAHGRHEYHQETIKNIHDAVKSYSEKIGIRYPLALAIETKGPRIRSGLLKGGGLMEVELKSGETIILTTDKEYSERGDSNILYIDYANIHSVINIGSKILVGLITLVCIEKQNPMLICTIQNGGRLLGRRYVTLPGTAVDLPALSEKDKTDLYFAIEQDVDIILASFIRSGVDVKEIRNFLGAKGSNIMIISKIENAQSIQNIDEIIEASDGIMIARGKLALEMSSEKVFISQKKIIAKCNKAGKPVICASQMLESLIKKPRPTRAESSDIANAILDGADCLMLCDETAKGDYLLNSIQAMSSICREAETGVWQKDLFTCLSNKFTAPSDAAETMAIATVEAATKCMASAIIIPTNSGRSAFLVSNYRPRCPIIAVSRNIHTVKQSHLHRAVLPLYYEAVRKHKWLEDMTSRIYFGINFGLINGFIKSGDPVVILSESKPGIGFKDTMKILYAVKHTSHMDPCCCIVNSH